MANLISEIQKNVSLYFGEQKFVLARTAFNTFAVVGNSTAINHIRKDKEEIKVLHWFDLYWVYFEIRLIERTEGKQINYPQIFLTISIFEGEASDLKKTQLFRAEWDNYEDNVEHPQPHWHIYPFQSYDEYSTFKDLVSSSVNSNNFTSYVQKPSKTVDLSKFHFAMNGQWYSHKGHITFIDNDTSLLNWISGVLGHIQAQLKYCS